MCVCLCVLCVLWAHNSKFGARLAASPFFNASYYLINVWSTTREKRREEKINEIGKPYAVQEKANSSCGWGCV